MDKIVKPVEGAVPYTENDPKKIIEQQPKVGLPIQNTKSSAEEKEGWIGKAVSFLSGGSPANVTADTRSSVDSSHYKFSPADRVVVQTAQGRAVTGTVRWVGPITASGKVEVSVVVGIETVSGITFFCYICLHCICFNVLNLGQASQS